MGRRLPSLSRAPGPTARTLASLRSLTEDSGRKMPEAVLASALTRWTRTRSRRGMRDLMERTEVAYSDENDHVSVIISVLCFRLIFPKPIALVAVVAAGYSLVPCDSHRSYSAIAKLADSCALLPQYVCSSRFLCGFLVPGGRVRAVGWLEWEVFAHHFEELGR